MSEKKIGREKEISDVVKLDRTAKTPTKADFNREAKNGTNINVGTVVKKRIFGKEVQTTLYPYFYLNNSMRFMTTEDYIEHKIYMDATEKFLGIDFSNAKTLLFDIADKAYYTGEQCAGIDEDSKPIFEPILPLYNEWQAYCDFVDNIPEYIEINFPDYSHKQFQYREQLKQSAQLYPDTIIKNIYEYLKEYGSNQHKKAKVDYLAQIGLPNINAINAIKIVELLYQQLKYEEM